MSAPGSSRPSCSSELAGNKPMLLTEACGSGDGNRNMDIVYTLKVSGEDSPKGGIGLVLVTDASGSMAGNALQMVKDVLLGVVGMLRDGDYLSIVTFNDVVTTCVETSRVANELKEEIVKRILNIKAEGQTDFGKGVCAGLEQLKHIPETHTKAMLVLSDGQVTTGLGSEKVSKKLEGMFKDKTQKWADTKIWWVPVGSECDMHLLSGLARLSRTCLQCIADQQAVTRLLPVIAGTFVGQAVHTVARDVHAYVCAAPGVVLELRKGTWEVIEEQGGTEDIGTILDLHTPTLVAGMQNDIHLKAYPLPGVVLQPGTHLATCSLTWVGTNGRHQTTSVDVVVPKGGGKVSDKTVVVGSRMREVAGDALSSAGVLTVDTTGKEGAVALSSLDRAEAVLCTGIATIHDLGNIVPFGVPGGTELHAEKTRLLANMEQAITLIGHVRSGRVHPNRAGASIISMGQSHLFQHPTPPEVFTQGTEPIYDSNHVATFCNQFLTNIISTWRERGVDAETLRFADRMVTELRARIARSSAMKSNVQNTTRPPNPARTTTTCPIPTQTDGPSTIPSPPPARPEHPPTEIQRSPNTTNTATLPPPGPDHQPTNTPINIPPVSPRTQQATPPTSTAAPFPTCPTSSSFYANNTYTPNPSPSPHHTPYECLSIPSPTGTYTPPIQPTHHNNPYPNYHPHMALYANTVTGPVPPPASKTLQPQSTAGSISGPHYEIVSPPTSGTMTGGNHANTQIYANNTSFNPPSHGSTYMEMAAQTYDNHIITANAPRVNMTGPYTPSAPNIAPAPAAGPGYDLHATRPTSAYVDESGYMKFSADATQNAYVRPTAHGHPSSSQQATMGANAEARPRPKVRRNPHADSLPPTPSQLQVNNSGPLGYQPLYPAFDQPAV